MSPFSPFTVHWCCKQCPMKSIKSWFWKAMICTGEFWTDQLWTLFLMEQAGFLPTIVINARKCQCPQNVQTHFSLLSDCNHYCYYLISYYYHLCRDTYMCVCICIYICMYVYNVNKSPVHPSCQPPSPSVAFVLGMPVSHEQQLFF